MAEPRDAYTVRKTIRRDGEIYQDDIEFSRGHKGAMIGTINEYTGGDANRHILLAWLFGEDDQNLVPISSHDLTDAQWYGIYRWIDSYQDENLEWRVQPNFAQEATWVLTCALIAYQKSEAFVRDELFDPPPELAAKLVELGGVIQRITEGERFEDDDSPDIGKFFVNKEIEL